MIYSFLFGSQVEDISIEATTEECSLLRKVSKKSCYQMFNNIAELQTFVSIFQGFLNFFRNTCFKEHLFKMAASQQNRLCYVQSVCTCTHILNQSLAIAAPMQKTKWAASTERLIQNALEHQQIRFYENWDVFQLLTIIKSVSDHYSVDFYRKGRVF